MYGVTGVETSWRLCFLVEYLAFELGQALPGHLSHPELAAAALPGLSSSCGHGRKELPAGGTTLEQLLQHQALALWELQSSAEQWEILQGWELSPGECADCCCLQSCSRSGMRGALACSPGAGQHWVLPSHHRGGSEGSPGQSIAAWTPKAKYQGYYTADLCSW